MLRIYSVSVTAGVYVKNRKKIRLNRLLCLANLHRPIASPAVTTT